MSKPWEPTWREPTGWELDCYIEGCRFRRRLGLRERSLRPVARQKAERLWRAELERRLAPPRPLGTAFFRAAASYIEDGGEARFLPPLMKHFGADTTIEEIGELEIVTAGATLYPGRSADTIRRQVRVPVTAVIRHAQGLRRRPRTDTRRTRWLTPEEAERLIQCADRILPQVAFLFGTGCRTGEMFALEVADMNTATRQAWIADPKNGHPRWVRYPARSAELLGDLPEVGAVFRTPKGLPYALREKGGGQMAAAFNKARDLAGLGDDVTPHVLRHTWATWYYAATRDFGGLMDLGGWQKADMANRYRKLAPDDLAQRLLDHGWDFRPDGQDMVEPARVAKIHAINQ